MPKLPDRNLFIAGLFFFAFWLYVALPFLYTVPRYSHDEATNKCSAEESKNHGFWEKASCDPTAYFTLWLVAFTGVLAVSTIGLWFVTARGVRTQTSDTRILQRAYISIEAQGINSLSNEISDTTAVAHIGIRNVGHLPAREVKWVIKCAVDGRRYREDFAVSDNEAFGRNVVSPGTIMTQGSDRFDFVEEAVGSEEGTFLYVWGAVYYRDGFDDTPPRTARFCHRYNYENLPSGHVDYFFKPDAARIHRYGNDAD